MHNVLLPAIFTVCAALGIPHSECGKNEFLLNGLNQTDKALWYEYFTASPSNNPPIDCYKPVAISRYQMFDGRWGTEYVCMAPPEEDRINLEELGAINDYAQRLNSKAHKTLADHQMALQIKALAASAKKQ